MARVLSRLRCPGRAGWRLVLECATGQIISSSPAEMCVSNYMNDASAGVKIEVHWQSWVAARVPESAAVQRNGPGISGAASVVIWTEVSRTRFEVR
ncbi:hypothetical protein NDU88_006648 [Pleurodeles waltl]|uniref:Uncharacterized protein n=1 Tax=Pleurodeles waltl TaxID=8319 RepID=A0AAV7N115_PLEWA|nr:hypothetical protein NDU88_006648 [Pleurodeles waltl]